MLCKKPFRKSGLELGCGKCAPCKLKHRRLWTARLVLEAALHADSCFITLTYNDQTIPQNNSLRVKDYQDFLKRLRRSSTKRLRFYIVGEYGTTTDRPHYHCVLYGFKPDSSGLLEHKRRDQLNLYGKQDKRLLDAWRTTDNKPKGNIHIGEVTVQSMAYSCSHITKSTHKLGDPKLNGRIPEFHRMSLRPGIGKNAIHAICDWLTTKEGARYVADHGDIPSALRMEQKLWPIGRYLKTCIKAELGMQDEQTDLAKYTHAMKHLAMIKDHGYDYNRFKRHNDALKAEQILQRAKFNQSL